MPNNHISKEILFTIIKQLKHEDIYEGSLGQCALTCRQWKQPAQAAMYSTLRIESTTTLNALMKTPNELGNYVQSIDYDMKFSGLSMIKIALLF